MLVFSLSIAEALGSLTAAPEESENSVLFQDINSTSTITNLSEVNRVSAAIDSFPVVKFRLTDAGGDELPTSLTQIVLIGKKGIADAAGFRMEDVLENIIIKDLGSGTEIELESVEFPDYNTVILHFAAGSLQTLEGGSATFVVFAQAKAEAAIADNTSFSIETNVNSFQTAPSSSGLSPLNINFEGVIIDFNIEATALDIQEEPAIVRAVKNINPSPDGEEFFVKIVAVDIQGRQDTDFNSSLSVRLKENGELGRELFGSDAALYPEMTNGEVFTAALMFKGNTLPAYFQLEVEAGAASVASGFSTPINAVAVQDKNSIISAVAGSGTVNIPFASFREEENLEVSNSASLGAFDFEDSPGSANDKMATTVTGLEIYLTSPGNIKTIALFEGTSRLVEKVVALEEDGLLHLDNFTFVTGNNQRNTLTVRATFQDTVNDNEKIAVRIHKIYADPLGSLFTYPESVVPEAELVVVGSNPANDVNRIEVMAGSLNIINLPENAAVGSAFSLSMEAVDEFGNRDLDVSATIAISKAVGPGSLTPAGHQQSMVSGLLELTGMAADQPGLYSILANDISTSISSKTTNIFQVYQAYSYEGLLISEIGQGTDSGTPNYLELYNASATESFGLENLELRVYENGESTPSYRIPFDQQASLATGEIYVISNVAFSDAWGEPFISFKEQQVNTGIAGNGNDVYEVYDLYHKRTVDVFGMIGENGDGKSWNYNQKLVNRRNEINYGNGGTFDVQEFTIVPYSHEIANPGFSTTTEFSAPSLTTVEPAKGSQAVMENSSFTFTFNEVLNFEDKAVSIKREDTDETVFTTSLKNSAVISGEGTRILQIQPSQLLPSAAALYFSIEEGGVTDLSGNSIPVLDYHFKTIDSIEPTLVSLLPADNSMDAGLEPVFRMTFSEDVEIGTGVISLYSADNGSLITSFPVSSGFVRHPSPHIIEFELMDRLDKLSSYYVLCSPGVVKDASGNLFAGIKTEEEWNFKTIDPYVNSPIIVSLTPFNGENNVAQDQVLKINFNRPILAGTGTIDLYNATTGAFVSSLNPETGEGITIADKEVLLNLGVLDFSTTYSVMVNPGAFIDPEGNPIEGTNSNFPWTFTVVPNANPILVLESNAIPLYFGNISANTTSEGKKYRLGGRNLLQDVELQVPEGFVVSVNGGNTYHKGTISLSVEKLKNFAELFVKFAPEVADGRLYQTSLVHHSEGAPTINLGLLAREGAQPSTLSIAEARALGVDAIVQVRAVVTDGSSFGNSRRFIQDATAGIAIYQQNNTVLSNLQLGTRVLVSGKVMQSNEGLLQISGDELNIEVEETGADFPEPISVYADKVNEQLESQLVEIKNLTFEKAGEQFGMNQSYLFTDTKGNSGRLKIEGLGNSLIGTDIPEIVTVRGLVAQIYDAYVLLPRNRADLQVMDPQISTTLPDGKLNFGFIQAGLKSAALRLRIYSSELAEDIEVSVAAPFQVSTSSVVNFSNNLKLPANTNGVDIWVRFAPGVANGEISRDLIQVSSNSANTVLLPVAGVEGAKPESVTIAQAKVLPLGEEVQVKGIVTSGNSISYNERYLQDASAGIVVHKVGNSGFSNIPLGAEVSVSGTLQEYNKLLQIGGTVGYEVLNENAGEVLPLAVNAAGIGEDNEAELLQLNGIQFIEEGNFEAGRKHSFLFPSGETGFLKIPSGDHPLVGVRLPYKANLTAVLSQSGDDYFVVPRQESDLEATDAVVSVGFPEGAMEFFFVPAGMPSQPKYFIVDGSKLEGPIDLSTISPFQLSTNGINYGISGSISQENASQIKIYVRFNPSISGGGVSEDFLTLRTTNGRPVKVPLTGIEGQRPEVLTIAQARALGAGESVKVEGVLTTNSRFYTNKRFIQDGTAGLVIAADTEEFLNMEIGDKITVSGNLTDHDGLLQLESNVDVSILQRGAGIPVPRKITTAAQISEANEAELIFVPSLRFVDQGYFEQGKAYKVFLENGEGAFLRVAGDNHSLAGKIIPAQVDVEAVIAQKGNKYEIWPRFEEDLQGMSFAMALLTDAPANGIDLGMTEAGTAGQWEQYKLTGVQLIEDISIAVAPPFEVSVDNTQWSNSLTVNKSAYEKVIFVRFKPESASGTEYFAELVHSSGGIRSVISLRAREGVKEPVEITALLEEFDLCLELNAFFQYDLAGNAQWGCAEGRGVNNSGAAGVFQDIPDAELNDDWLISPAFLITTASRLSFDVARQHQGPELELLVSSDYRGSGNPGHASWEKIPVNLPSPFTSLSSFERIEGINLSAYAGREVYLAFRYTATYEEASAYIIDNFKLQNMPTIGFLESTKSVQEGTTEQVRLILSHEAPQETSLKVSVENANGVGYGEGADYLTNPSAATAPFTIQVPAGMQEVSFDLNVLEDWKEEGDEQVIFRISEVGEGMLLDEGASEVSITFKSNNATEMSIPEAREISEQGILEKLNQLVKLKGLAYGPNLPETANGLEFRLIDHSQSFFAAITVLRDNASELEYSLAEGDSLEIIGLLREVHGLAVLVPQKVKVIQQKVSLREPEVTLILTEDLESNLVAIENVEIVRGWVNNPSAPFDLTVKNEEGSEYLVQIRTNSDLYGSSKPTGKMTFTGFVGQKDFNAPYTEGYYLIHKSKTDVKQPTALNPSLAYPDIIVYPNPASEELHIRSSENHKLESLEVLSLNGNLLIKNTYKEGDSLNLTALPSGIYLVRLISKDGSFIIKKFSVLK